MAQEAQVQVGTQAAEGAVAVEVVLGATVAELVGAVAQEGKVVVQEAVAVQATVAMGAAAAMLEL